MSKMAAMLIFAIFFITASMASEAAVQPNIIIVLADDFGWNDIGYHNPEVISPNLDQLAREGVILDRNYAQAVCTPSRSSLMTGMYPYKIGRQGQLPIGENVPTGLTLDYKLLPQYLQEFGYQTHLVGKWHLGFCKPEYLPLNRGFDTFFGFWSGYEDYYDNTLPIQYLYFHDFFDNQEVHFNDGTYSTNIYANKAVEIIENHNTSVPFFMYAPLQSTHDPLQAPKEYEDLYPNATTKTRQTYLGMVTAMDDFVGTLVQSLKKQGMYEDTVIIFSSDNGGLVDAGGASNLPLKGQKSMLYEGGIRVPGFVHSPNFVKNPGRIHDKLVHITDWVPTILRLATGEEVSLPIDGINQYDSIFADDSESNGRTMMINELSHDAFRTFRGAIQTSDGWKILRNPDWIPLEDTYFLYNVLDDPYETTDLKDQYPEKFQDMKNLFMEKLDEMVPEDLPLPVPFADITDGKGNIVTGWCT